MVNINLLPPEIKLRVTQAKKSANIFSICLVTILFIALVCFALYELKSNYLQAELDSTRATVQSADSTLGKYGNLEKEALFINERMQLATSLEGKRAQWSVIVQDLINSAPGDVQFVSLGADLNKTPNFVLQGNTTSEREAIKFRDKLESSQFFKDVVFKSSSVSTGSSNNSGGQQNVSATQNLNFTLEFNIESLSPKATTSGGTK